MTVEKHIRYHVQEEWRESPRIVEDTWTVGPKAAMRSASWGRTRETIKAFETSAKTPEEALAQWQDAQKVRLLAAERLLANRRATYAAAMAATLDDKGRLIVKWPKEHDYD